MQIHVVIMGRFLCKTGLRFVLVTYLMTINSMTRKFMTVRILLVTVEPDSEKLRMENEPEIRNWSSRVRELVENRRLLCPLLG